MHLEYPAAPLSAQIDDYHGETVADPFRWLEDTSSEATRGFIEAENRLADAWLEAVPSREEITHRVHELWDHPRFGVPFERGGQWFQYRNSGLQPQPVLYVMDRPGADGEILVDPNAFSEDGTVALVDAVPSADGRLLAYATADAGSDWLTWRVLDVDKKTLLPDVVEWSKFSTAAWVAGASGFFYGAPRRPEPGQELEGETRGLQVLFHLLGAKDGEDEVVFSTEDQPDWLPQATVTDDGRYLVVAVTRGTRPQVRLEIFDLEHLGEGSVVLDPDFSCELAVAGNEGPRFFLVTGEGADRRRLVATDLSDPEQVEEVVPESADVLAGAKRCGDALVCWYLKDAQAALRVHGLNGRFTCEIGLPPWTSLVNDEHGAISGRAGLGVIHFATTSFTDSGSVWSHDLGSGETMLVHPPGAPFDADDYVTERGYATSADGTRVPFFCTHRRDLSRDGELPVLVYGYGGFNIPLGPEWSVMAAVFIERGGAYVLANLRGGGEFGRAWHDGGRLEHKQHVFDDFVAVARGARTVGPVAPGTDRDPRRVERGPARGRVDHSAPRGVRCRRRRGGGARHAEVPQVHDRLGVVVRLRRPRRPRAVPVVAGVLAAPQHPRRREVSGDSASHRGPRRPRRSGPLLQIRGRASTRARRRRPDPAPGGGVRRPRCGQADEHADSRERRRAHLCRGGARRQPPTRRPRATLTIEPEPDQGVGRESGCPIRFDVLGGSPRPERRSRRAPPDPFSVPIMGHGG